MKKRYNFKTEDHMLTLLDGNIYAIANRQNNRFICDVHEDEFDALCLLGIIVNRNEIRYFDLEVEGNESDYVLSADRYEEIVLANALIINIKENV